MLHTQIEVNSCVHGTINQVIKTKTKAIVSICTYCNCSWPTKAQELLHSILFNLLMSQKICGSCILSNKSQDELAGGLVYSKSHADNTAFHYYQYNYRPRTSKGQQERLADNIFLHLFKL